MPRLEQLAELTGHTDRVWNVAWHPSGKEFASCGGDKTVRIWSEVNSADGKSRWICKATLEDGHRRTVRWVAWSPNGATLATASFDGTTAIWTVGSDDEEDSDAEESTKSTRVGTGFTLKATLEGHENEVKCVAWDASGSLLASCSRDKSVWVWESTPEHDFECLAVLHDHQQDVKMVTWHPNKELLVSASYDDTIKVWQEDSDDWGCTDTLSGHTSTVWGVSFDKTGDRLVSCSDDTTVKIWLMKGTKTPSGSTLSRGKCVCTLSGYHTRTIFSVDWCKKTGRIVTASADDTVCVFAENEAQHVPEQPSFDLLCRTRAHSQDVNCVRWNPVQNDIFATAGDDRNIKIWRIVDD
mmetsp:Transcript_23085/g.37979  ORF Transcript_23085/g.37979 Transcript_23085/m.37979 type:complete len:354 (+) Transcript_23085:45-1106(+)